MKPRTAFSWRNPVHFPVAGTSCLPPAVAAGVIFNRQNGVIKSNLCLPWVWPCNRFHHNLTSKIMLTKTIDYGKKKFPRIGVEGGGSINTKYRRMPNEGCRAMWWGVHVTCCAEEWTLPKKCCDRLTWLHVSPSLLVHHVGCVLDLIYSLKKASVQIVHLANQCNNDIINNIEKRGRIR